MITEFARSALPGVFADGGSVRYDAEHIPILSDDLALTSVRQRYLDPAGAPTGDRLPSYVWRRN